MRTAPKTSDPRSRGSLRLDPKVWEAVDEARSGRPGFISRNTWVMEAILEKLANEQQNTKQRKHTGSGNA
jgi:hypothetical protein